MAELTARHGQEARSEWERLATAARQGRRLRMAALTLFLAAVSIPIIVPYFWMVMIAFTARSGEANTGPLWVALGVLVPVTFG